MTPLQHPSCEKENIAYEMMKDLVATHNIMYDHHYSPPKVVDRFRASRKSQVDVGI